MTPDAVLAHDPSLHRAKAAYGTVASVKEGSVTIEQDGKVTTYVVMPDTKIVRDEKRIGAGEVRPGAPVAIFAVKLPDGTMAASEVNLLGTGSEAAAPGHGGGQPHEGADGVHR
jgi:hypothetical protein